MPTAVYLDCSAGLSGDMAAAAFADLLEEPSRMEEVLRPYTAFGAETVLRRVEKNGQSCLDLDIRTPAEGHVHRTLSEVKARIAAAACSEEAKALAETIYERIGNAEALVHGASPETVRFHEVGSLRALMQVVAFASAYEALGRPDVIVEALHEGSGTVECAHGTIAVPAPAVRAIVDAAGIPLVCHAEIHGEILTPSGAAIAAEAGSVSVRPDRCIVKRCGYGAGKRDTGLCGYVRAELLEF
jgi:hypothetical protein